MMELPIIPMTDEEVSYYEQHDACPKCGNESDNMLVTSSAGMSSRGWKLDRNKCWCKCGWEGIVDDLVPSRVLPRMVVHADAGDLLIGLVSAGSPECIEASRRLRAGADLVIDLTKEQ